MSKEVLSKLIERGVTITQAISDLKEELKEIKAAIDPYFPAEKTTEELVTDSGMAVRKVSNSWGIDEANLGEITKILGASYLEFVSENIDYKPRPKLRKLVLDADSEIGNRLRSYVHVEQGVAISFKALANPVPQNELEIKLRGE